MSLEDHTNRILLLILVSCMMVVAVSLILHQLALLLYFVLIYWVIWMLLWGVPLIYVGVKELREARQNGERIHWHQNKNVLQGIVFVLPPLLEVSRDLGRSGHPIGNSGWLILDIFEITLMSVFLVPLLFFEVILTIGFIRYLLKKTNPYTHSLQGIFTEGQTPEE